MQYTPGRLVRVAEDWTISPRVLNHFAIGYNRFGNLNQSVYVDQDWPNKLGIQNVSGNPLSGVVLSGRFAESRAAALAPAALLRSGTEACGYNGSLDHPETT